MSNARDLQERLVTLSNQLSRIESVRRLDDDTEKQSDVIAVGLLDIEASCRAIIDRHLPKLFQPEATVDEIKDVLMECNLEFQHIVYHIRDMKYFSYILEDVEVCAEAPKS
jgi:hypothetical protein